MTCTGQIDEVWAVLERVTDPEIDESVTKLEFVTRVEIEAGSRVRIEFRLPTYWCAPNFAFLMASDMRDAVEELPWVEEVSV
jgi:metal-sulfur cluster biosynthetic enzyme